MPWHLVALSAVLVVTYAALCLLDAGASAQYSVEGRRSGYTYLSPENQRLQDDDFANPGLLWVEQGRELWRQTDGTSHASCATCHGEAEESMRGVRTRYPRVDSQRGKLINLEQQINRCREVHLQAPAYPYESAALLALTTFVSWQSRGLPMAVHSDGPAAPFFAAGKHFFHQRRGQLDLACAHCHDQHAGQRLRGEVISQGQTNGFPPSTATSGRRWVRRIACSPGAIPLCALNPTRTATTFTSIWSCSWPGGAVAYPSKPLPFGAESHGIGLVSQALGVLALLDGKGL